MNDTSADAGFADHLLALGRERDFEALEAAWMEHLEPEPRDLEDLFRVGQYLVRRGFADRAELLLWSLVTAVAEQDDAKQTLGIAKRAAHILPEAAVLREEISTSYRRAYPDVPELDMILNTSGLADGKDLDDAIRFIEYCLHLRPGAYVVHARSRRVGRLGNFEDGQYVVKSEGSEQRMTPTEVLERWEPIENDDIRALIVYEVDRLRELVANDPAELVRLVARSCKGEVDFKQLKQFLVQAVIPSDDWSAWWGSAKVVIRRSPFLSVSGKTQPQFKLLDAEQGYSQKLRADFEAAPNPLDKITIVTGYLSELAAGHEADPKLAGRLGEDLINVADKASDPAMAIALLSAASEVRARFPEAPDPGPVLVRRVAEMPDATAFAIALKDDVVRMVLRAIKSAHAEGWPQIFAAVFPAASSRLCDSIARDLVDAGHEHLLIAGAETALTLPDQYPEALVWIWRACLTQTLPLAERFDRISLTTSLLHLMTRLARLPRHAPNRAEARRKLAKLRSIVGASDFAHLRRLIEESDIDAARRLHQAIASNTGLGEHDRNELRQDLEAHYPEEFVETKPLWEDGHTYTTADGLARRTAEIEKLINEDMHRNAKAIGEAAARGDLRENWEYKAALEERDRLVERITRGKAELDTARLIDFSAIPDGEVSIGTVVRLRDVVAEVESTVIFLGPWDADIAHGVYSYQAPLSLRFMGKKVGDRLEASFGEDEKTFEIVDISLAD